MQRFHPKEDQSYSHPKVFQTQCCETQGSEVRWSHPSPNPFIGSLGPPIGKSERTAQETEIISATLLQLWLDTLPSSELWEEQEGRHLAGIATSEKQTGSGTEICGFLPSQVIRKLTMGCPWSQQILWRYCFELSLLSQSARVVAWPLLVVVVYGPKRECAVAGPVLSSLWVLSKCELCSLPMLTAKQVAKEPTVRRTGVGKRKVYII